MEQYPMLPNKIHKLANFSTTYLLLFVFYMVILVLVMFWAGSLFGGDIDSARYLLSAEAQAQAAILAVVVSLTFVAIQLSSQSYSSRVIELFVKQRGLWLLLFLYGFSISYDLVILSLISKEFSNIGIFVGFSLVLMILAIGALFRYTNFAIENLRPGRIVSDIKTQIDRKELLSQIDGLVKDETIKFESFGEETLIRPIVDIVKTRITEGDTVTAKVVLNEIRNIAIDTLTGIEDPKETEKILNFFFWHVHEIWEVALAKKDALIAKEVLICLKEIVKTNKNTLNSISYWYQEIFSGLFFNEALQNGWNEFLNELINSQKELAPITAEYDLENAFSHVINTLGSIGTGIKSEEYPYSFFVFDINKNLGKFATIAASKKEWRSETAKIFDYITKTSQFLIENTAIVGTAIPTEDLETIAQTLIDHNFYGDGWWEKAYEYYLLRRGVYAEVGSTYAEKMSSVSLKHVIDSLERIGIYAIKSRNGLSVKPVIETLESIGYSDCKVGNPNIDYFFDAFNNIRNKTPENLKIKIYSYINSSAEALIKEIVKIVRWDEREDLDVRDYCHALILIGREYGFDEIVRKVFRENEDSKLLSEERDKRFEELKKCYFEAEK